MSSLSPSSPEPPLPTTLEAVDAEATQIAALLQRARWLRDPELWARDRFGIRLWSGQVRIMCAVRDHRRTAVATCHEVGKSFSAALLTAWWIDCHKLSEAFVVTSAPTAPQVRTILWREIGRIHARGGLAGRTNQTEWMVNVNGKDEQVAIGRKPDEYNPTAMQGIHAPFVLAILDEAGGIGTPLREAIDSLIANDNSKVLEIGNPDDPNTPFHENCKPGSGYHVIQISAFDTPNFTGEPMPPEVLRQLIGRTYVEEKRRKWAPEWYWVDKDGNECSAEQGVRCVCPAGKNPSDTNPYWQSKVLGVFPVLAGVNSLIPLAWIRAAQQRTLEVGEVSELGVDVGGGGDATTVCHRRGKVYRIIREDHDPDTMSQCGKIIVDMQRVGATKVKIDKIGIGWGVVNRGQELGHPFIGINVSEGAVGQGVGTTEEELRASQGGDERFLNLKAQLYWHVRTLFERGDVDIDEVDEDLAADLANVRYERGSTGLIKIADKRKNAQGQATKSPNRGESLMLCAAPTEFLGLAEIIVREAAWA